MNTVSLSADRSIDGRIPIYGDLTLLTVERHGSFALAPHRTYDFAAKHPVVPLTIDEFERAALDYPIIFFGAARRAFAVTSVAPARNDFIDENGNYCGGAYIPAYLRRHPFVLVRDPDSGLSVLGIDETAASFCESNFAGAQPLFEGNMPTEFTKGAVAFCEGYEEAQRRTATLVTLLDDFDLFEARQAYHRPRLASGALGEPELLIDYAAVNRERFEALDAATHERLRAIGAPGAIYAHLMSAANWDRLALIGS